MIVSGMVRADRDAAIGGAHKPCSQRAAVVQGRLEGGADASGNVIGQRLEWLPEMIPALGRAYFEIPKMPPAAQYRVTVWSYDRLKGGSGA